MATGTAPLWPGTTTFPSSSTYPGHRSTGDPIYPGATLYPSSSTYPGQGDKPLHQVLIAFDDASVYTPTWVEITGRVRSFDISRGRATELQRVDAGTAQFTLDNRDRAFDPTNGASPYYPNVRAMNRVWHRVQFAGETHSLFFGYVESYQQQWPQMVDAVTTVSCADEFKVLALKNLPSTNPPRDSYSDVVMYDEPAGYWHMDDASATVAAQAVVGPSMSIDPASGVMVSGASGAIIGQEAGDGQVGQSITLAAGNRLAAAAVDAMDLGGLSAVTVEAWLKVGSLAPSSTSDLFGLELGAWLDMTTTGQLFFQAINSGGTTYGNSVLGVALLNTWAHVVGVVNGSQTLLYINGVLVATDSFTGVLSNTATLLVAGDTTTTLNVAVDECAIYRYALSADRILAHYTAGVARGFAHGQAAGARIGGILDAASSHAPRDLDPGTRTLTGQYKPSQSALDVLREPEAAEAVDAFLFVKADGTVAFRDASHRGRAAYTAPSMTFSDDGRFLPYQDLVVDYSDSFIANDWTVSAKGSLSESASDDTSISRYLSRPQTMTDLILTGDTGTYPIALAMLTKYKEPMLRVTQIQPKANDPDVLEQVFRAELGDRIRVIRTPPGGGAPFDQQVFLQQIQISGTPQQIYPKIVLGVSPV